ncbi:unnamed protein product [Bursaphelenchus xylophilus]|uniref:(pine wood nematode) hypothetical protein n=1 Tax=Bursaphelenchus xylophilus TaxID=6326 RepID=A0A1I7RVX1_BURXY|nr:unnamed protein product [Bursaphelenchus xylophilus]CAG9094815.1 unnamed protein product [Bursaphelenchus xylophilus]
MMGPLLGVFVLFVAVECYPLEVFGRAKRSEIIPGNRIVRYEIQPMPHVPSSDKSQCLDRTGKHRKDGEEYECTLGIFKLKCNKGQEEVTACLGSDRTDKKWIKVGETLNVNGFWHKCERFDNSSVVYHQELSCRDENRKEVHVGDEVIVASLRLKCVEGGYLPIGCYIPHKDGGIKLKEGEEKTIDGFPFTCKTASLHRKKRDEVSALGAGVAAHGATSWSQVPFPSAEELGKSGSEIKADPETSPGATQTEQVVNAKPVTLVAAKDKPKTSR